MWGSVGWGCDAAGAAWAGCVLGAGAARCAAGLGRGLEWAVVQGRPASEPIPLCVGWDLSLWGRFECWWTGRDAGCVGRGWLTPRWSRRSPAVTLSSWCGLCVAGSSRLSARAVRPPRGPLTYTDHFPLPASAGSDCSLHYGSGPPAPDIPVAYTSSVSLTIPVNSFGIPVGMPAG